MGKRRYEPDKGASHRLLKVGEMLRRAAADILLRGDVHDPELARYSITVTEARPSPDLRHVTLFVSPLGGADEAGALEVLERNKSEFRRALGREVHLKYTPAPRFEIDRSYDRMQEANRMLADERVRRDLKSS